MMLTANIWEEETFVGIRVPGLRVRRKHPGQNKAEKGERHHGLDESFGHMDWLILVRRSPEKTCQII